MAHPNSWETETSDVVSIAKMQWKNIWLCKVKYNDFNVKYIIYRLIREYNTIDEIINIRFKIKKWLTQLFVQMWYSLILDAGSNCEYQTITIFI